LRSIKLRLDTYIQETLDQYMTHVKTVLKPTKVPMQSGVMLENTNCPETPDPLEQETLG
jgi:hypothetical protein